MKTAAVLLDDWKLTIFKKHLDTAGFSYTQQQGLTQDTLTLRVSFRMVADLKPVVEAANAECARMKMT